MRFGRQLREERERLGVTVEAIAAATRVPLRQLHSLEADLFDELPTGIVRRGIVRSYCKHIGLDETLWLDRFAEAGGLPPDEPDQEKLAEFAENVRRSRASADPVRSRWLWVVLMLLGLVVAGTAAWKFAIQPKVFPPPPPALEGTPAEAPPAVQPDTAPAAAPPAPAPKNRRRHRPVLPQTAAPVN